MKAFWVVGLFLATGAALAADRPLPVLIKNPSVLVQDAAAGEYTHVGQKPSQLVELGLNRTFEGRVDPQTGGTTSFVVPDGFLFVLTDIQWEASCTNGTLVHFSLVRHKPSGTSDGPVRGAAVCEVGEAHFERHYTTGELFGEGQSFRVDAVFGLSATPAEGVFASVQGYLVPAD